MPSAWNPTWRSSSPRSTGFVTALRGVTKAMYSDVMDSYGFHVELKQSPPLGLFATPLVAASVDAAQRGDLFLVGFFPSCFFSLISNCQRFSFARTHGNGVKQADVRSRLCLQALVGLLRGCRRGGGGVDLGQALRGLRSRGRTSLTSPYTSLQRVASTCTRCTWLMERCTRASVLYTHGPWRLRPRA